MKKLFTRIFSTGLALAALMLLPAQASAQDIGETEGYANVFIRLQVTKSGAGRISALPPQGGLDNYKETIDFQKTLPVASTVQIVYFTAKARETEGSHFVGWYVDDGDGTFDITKDEFLSSETPQFIYFSIGDLGLTDDDIYETEAQAKAAAQPTQPQRYVFAHFTNGATAEPDYKMGMGEFDFHMGTVEIDKPINEPGDVITIKAIPAEGYQFEYWKTAYSSQWGEEHPNTVVSRDATYTFTVKGGEHYYAYFSAIDAPVIELPEEGGWYCGAFEKVWQMHELSDAFVYVPSLIDVDDNTGEPLFDIITDEQQRSYFDLNDEEAKYDNTFHFSINIPGYGNEATLIYGKGTVRFTHNSGVQVTFNRAGNLLQWSGPKGYTFKDPNNIGYHLYAFRTDLGAFVKIGTTDLLYEEATTQVTIPANTCYLNIEAVQLADPVSGYIPDIIALTPELFEKAVTGISDAKVQPVNIGRHRMYTLSGVEVKATAEKGVYIINGKKTVIK